MRRMKKTICVLLSLFCVLCPARAHADDSTEAFLELTYTQCDERWAAVQVGILSIADSACGIATVCNAVYYLTGVELELLDVAVWANNSGLYNTSSVAGCYRSVFFYAGEEYGDAIGFTATQYTSGDIDSEEITETLLAGGTVGVHVPGHFMALVDYDPVSERFLVIDPMPGDQGRYDTRRRGLTHTTGDWLTAEQLSQGYIDVDGYSLFTRKLSDTERQTVAVVALAASGSAQP